ncbi:MAG: alpha/beta hydrolase family protein [Pirellulales bacterium]
MSTRLAARPCPRSTVDHQRQFCPPSRDAQSRDSRCRAAGRDKLALGRVLLWLLGFGAGGFWALVSSAVSVAAAETSGPAPTAFLQFIRSQADQLRAGDAVPRTRGDWETRRQALRNALIEAWGGFPAEPCPLEPRVLGTLQREGYRIERLLLQTRPGNWMTANAYVPDRPGKVPAVLCVHGHWRLAKQEPVVQARCIGLVRQGFFVLVVDACGAGERATGKALGEYHGEMTAATLYPSGLTLSGLQVYENRRAVDYLQSRPEVDATKIAITGASGGGNQSMYAGTFDERITATIPVCSVGNYRAYLGAACCQCEVVPGALRFTEEGDVLGLAAPRALMVINATGDARQFSVAEARVSLERASAIFHLYERDAAVRHTIIESGHDYNQAMREAMYGWVRQHLAGSGTGQPFPEVPLKTEDPEVLRCFPGDSRPDDFVTLPQFAAAEARRVLTALPLPAQADTWPPLRDARATALRDRVLGGWPSPAPLALAAQSVDGGRTWLQYDSEPDLKLGTLFVPTADGKRTVVLLDCIEPAQTLATPLAQQLAGAGWSLLIPELRATGRTAVPGDTIGSAPDHNSAEWSLWIGRPLLGQWAWDVHRSVAALRAHRPDACQSLSLVGRGQAGPVALVTAALDDSFRQVACLDSLVTMVSAVPYRGQRLGIFAPGILRHAGDIPHLAALVRSERVVLAGGVLPDGRVASALEVQQVFAPVTHLRPIRLVPADQLSAALAAP